MHDAHAFAAVAPDADATTTIRELYFALAAGTPDDGLRARARRFLDAQVAASAAGETALPADPNDLLAWMRSGTDEVGESYGAYLRGRRGGEPRRYFPSKAHALGFLQAVAPTKLVDGAWLFGTLERWDDAAFRPLITTYLEELGSGLPNKNHVALYQSLLTGLGCDNWRTLPERNFVQGAIQLALAWNAEHFLPELIGFNLGYEQLPLHLLITSYELNELGIDPYYFVLHVTVDNASSGHALKAIEALQALMPAVGDRDAFYRRVQDGFRLNDVGAGTNELIASFDLERELTRILVLKSEVGKQMHSDYCRIAGRTVNQWLAVPAQVPAFLAELVKAKWIERGAPAEQSRFWRLIHGDNAEMFGVFSGYEQEVLRCWIEQPGQRHTAARPLTYRAARRRHESTFKAPVPAHGGAPRPLLRSHAERADPQAGFGTDLRLLEQQLADMGSKQQAMRHLLALMSPSVHHTPVGLMATRIFQQLLDQAAPSRA